jgi:integrase
MRAIWGYHGRPYAAAALKLSALLFVRPGELRAAEWREMDLDDSVWRIPAAKMKMRHDHPTWFLWQRKRLKLYGGLSA